MNMKQVQKPSPEGRIIGSVAEWGLKKVFIRDKKRDILQGEIDYLDKALLHVESLPETTISAPIVKPPDADYGKLSQVAANGKACNVCLNDHFSTVSGALSEAIRFARKDGVEHPEVLTRISMSEDELNIGERIDGAPEKVAALAPDEKVLMEEMLTTSRHLRHLLSDIRDFKALESTAAEAQTARKEFRSKLFKMQMARMSPEERTAAKSKAQEVLNNGHRGNT